MKNKNKFILGKRREVREMGKKNKLLKIQEQQYTADEVANKVIETMFATFAKTTRETQKKTAVPTEEIQEQQLRKINLDSLEGQKRDYLSLAKKFHVPISFAIKHYDTLSELDT